MASKIHFYNIESHVGKGRQNEATDVLLVKFFLREIAEASKLPSAQVLGQPFIPPTPTLLLDATPSNDLFQWIEGYQKAKKQSTWIDFRPDGIVSPVPLENMQPTYKVRGSNEYRTRDRYTLYALNFEYRQMFPESWANLARDPKIPSILRDRFG